MSSESALVRKLTAFSKLAPQELKCLADLQSQPRKIGRQTELVHEGQSGHSAFILQDGWAYCYKLLRNGRRQVINFPLSGDFMGLRSVLLRTSDHSFATLTEATVSEVSGARMLEAFHELPRLGIAILWAASRDEAMVVEHLVDIGRRDALERMAHLFLELGKRLQLIGYPAEAGFECPLTQEILADALGLSIVHVNRTLRQLREREIITLKSGTVVIHDLERLGEVAEFDNHYLDHSSDPE